MRKMDHNILHKNVENILKMYKYVDKRSGYTHSRSVYIFFCYMQCKRNEKFFFCAENKNIFFMIILGICFKETSVLML